MSCTALRLNPEPAHEDHPCFAAEHGGGHYSPPPSRPRWLIVLCLLLALLASFAAGAAGCLAVSPRPGLSGR